MRKHLLANAVVVAAVLAVLLTPSWALAAIISSIPAGPNSVLLRTNGHTQVVRYQPGDRVEVVATFNPSPLSGWTMPPQRMQVFGGYECWLHEFQTSPGYCAGAGGFVDGTGDMFWNYAYQPVAIRFTADRVGAIFVTVQDFDFARTATAEVLVTVNDPNPPRTTAESKRRHSQLSQQWKDKALGLAATATVCLFIPHPAYSRLCAGPLAISAGIAQIAANEYSKLSADPPDSNYGVIDQPVVPVVPPAGNGVAEAELDALNANLAQTLAYLGPLTSV
jgi:hypothetical protein